MPAYTLPANLRSKATIKVYANDQESNPNGETYVIPVSSLAVGAYDAIPPVDNTYNGAVITAFNAGTTLTRWQAVYISSASTVLVADANLAGAFPARGLVVADTANGAPATILTQGVVRNDAWNWTVGGNIFLSETAGGLTQTPPVQTAPTAISTVHTVGWAVSADVAIFTFNPIIRPVWETTSVGNATLVTGAVTVADTRITANSIVVPVRKTASGTIGTSFTYTVTAGVGFTITSNNALDTSVVTYFVNY